MSEASICPDCAGLGVRRTRVNYGKHDRVSSVAFDLKANCETCGGTGYAEEGRPEMRLRTPAVRIPIDDDNRE